MESIRTALELYYSDYGKYPLSGTGDGNWASQCAAWSAVTANNVIPALIPNYISQFPSDTAMNVTANQNCFIYRSTGSSYKLLSYNLFDVPGSGPATPANLVDPMRNYGQSYTRPQLCNPQSSYTESTRTRAMYSDSDSQCW